MEVIIAAYLVICSIGDQGGINCLTYKEPDMQTCIAVLGKTIVKPEHAGGDMQTQAVVSCSSEDNYFYSRHGKNEEPK